MYSCIFSDTYDSPNSSIGYVEVGRLLVSFQLIFLIVHFLHAKIHLCNLCIPDWSKIPEVPVGRAVLRAGQGPQLSLERQGGHRGRADDSLNDLQVGGGSQGRPVRICFQNVIICDDNNSDEGDNCCWNWPLPSWRLDGGRETSQTGEPLPALSSSSLLPSTSLLPLLSSSRVIKWSNCRR